MKAFYTAAVGRFIKKCSSPKAALLCRPFASHASLNTGRKLIFGNRADRINHEEPYFALETFGLFHDRLRDLILTLRTLIGEMVRLKV